MVLNFVFSALSVTPAVTQCLSKQLSILKTNNLTYTLSKIKHSLNTLILVKTQLHSWSQAIRLKRLVPLRLQSSSHYSYKLLKLFQAKVSGAPKTITNSHFKHASGPNDSWQLCLRWSSLAFPLLPMWSHKCITGRDIARYSWKWHGFFVVTQFAQEVDR